MRQILNPLNILLIIVIVATSFALSILRTALHAWHGTINMGYYFAINSLSGLLIFGSILWLSYRLRDAEKFKNINVIKPWLATFLLIWAGAVVIQIIASAISPTLLGYFS